MVLRAYVHNQIRNIMAWQRLKSLPENNIYARVYAQFHQVSHHNQASLHAAGAALLAAEQQMIEQKLHDYDMVVLEKTAERVRVRDRRGAEHDLLDLVTNSYNDLEWAEGSRESLQHFVGTAPLSSCISRKIAGLHSVHHELRTELADFMGYPSCVLGTCGYISQLSTLFALFHEGDVIFSDALNHSSLVDGCRLSHAKVIPFPHRDYEALERLLKIHRWAYNGAGIVSDGVFSTRGSVANMDRLVELARRHNCISVVDDTHGVLVLGRQGRGVVDLFERRPDVITGGFGKAFGSFGGFALSSRELGVALDLMGRQNVNTSFMSPVMAAQSLFQLRYYREHHAEVSGALMARARLFNAELGKGGLACYPEPEKHLHPIFCLYKRNERETLNCHRKLLEEGYFCSFFPPPVAPYPSLRISLHRCLPEAELVRLARLLARMDLFVDSGGTVGNTARCHPDTHPQSPGPVASRPPSWLDRLRMGVGEQLNPPRNQRPMAPQASAREEVSA